MSSPQPGWYDDPAGGGQRYWDGNTWTDLTRPSTTSPSPAASPAGEVRGAGGISPDIGSHGGRGRGPVLVAVAVVAVVGLAVAAVALVGGFGESDEAPELAIDEPEPVDEPAPEPEESDASEESEESEEPEESELEDDLGPTGPQGPFAESGTVTVLHALTGEADVAGLRAMLDEFMREYPDIEVLEQGSADFEQLTRSRVEGGNPPDLVFHPQPGLARDLWQRGLTRSLEHAVDASELREQVVGGLAGTMTFDRELAGLPVRVAPKSGSSGMNVGAVMADSPRAG